MVLHIWRLEGLVERSHEYEAGILREMRHFLVAVNHQLSLKLGSRQTFCRLLRQLQCRKVLPNFFLEGTNSPSMWWGKLASCAHTQDQEKAGA